MHRGKVRSSDDDDDDDGDDDDDDGDGDGDDGDDDDDGLAKIFGPKLASYFSEAATTIDL